MNDPVITSDDMRVVDYDVPLAFERTMAPLRVSASDPTSGRRGAAFVKALRTVDGPATVAVRQTGPAQATFWAWGPGSETALATAEGWLGLSDTLETFDPSPHPVVFDLARRFGPVRMGRFGSLTERLVPVIFGQLVLGKEAKRSYQRLVKRHGEPAPGPSELMLAPSPQVLTELGSHDFHQVGVERKRAGTVQRVARDASRLDRLVDAPTADAYRRLRSIPGIGPWTIASVGRVAFGDPDCVVVGDYNLPHIVSWALLGKRRSTDEEMLELLALFAGHRGRVQAMLKSAGAKPPRRGPRNAFREIERH